MSRRSSNLAAIVSLVLFVVIVGLWVETGFHRIAYVTQDAWIHQLHFVVANVQGAVGIGGISDFHPEETGWVVNTESEFDIVPKPHEKSIWFGLGYVWDRDERLIIVPHWMLALLAAILPVRWWLRRRREGPHDADAVPCPACGYDLRGSPSGTCPECGARRETKTVNAKP